jgi:hypothetical protein
MMAKEYLAVYKYAWLCILEFPGGVEPKYGDRWLDFPKSSVHSLRAPFGSHACEDGLINHGVSN